MYRFSTPTLFVVLSLLILACSSAVIAQDTDPTPTPPPVNPELQQLIDQNAILEQKKKAAQAAQAIAEAEKAELAAKFPKPTTTPLAGSTEVDANVKIEGQMMAYRAMAVNADRVAFEIQPVSMKRLAIFSFEQVKLLQNYSATWEQIDIMMKAYVEHVPAESKSLAAIGPALAAGSSLVGSVADLLAFFRTDTVVKGQSYTIGETAFASEIFRAIRKPGSGFDPNLQLYFPSEFAPNPNGLKSYPLIVKIEELNRERLRAGEILIQIEELEQKKTKVTAKIKDLKARSKAVPGELISAKDSLAKFESINRQYPSARALEKVIDAKKEHADLLIEEAELPLAIKNQEKLLAEHDQALSQLYTQFKNGKSTLTFIKALNAQFDKFYAEITTVTAGGVNPLGLYLQAEQLRFALGCITDNPACPETYFLAIKVIEAGGNIRTKKNLFTTLFTGADITHSGGTIAEYRLYDGVGVVKRSNTFANYEYYRKPKNIAKMADENFQSESQEWLEKKAKELTEREAKLKAAEAKAQPPQKSDK